MGTGTGKISKGKGGVGTGVAGNRRPARTKQASPLAHDAAVPDALEEKRKG
jgi:hypothetical protein